MSDYIHMRHGDDSQNKELLELLNKSFDFTKDEDKFETLLPKLYKDKYHPAKNNIILDVNGDNRAAVGTYYDTLSIGETKLSVAGIGNVAVLPEHRGKGYMQFCMALALDEFKQNMVDIARLGGARQRYEHFSFEPAGVQYAFTYTKDNVIRTLGNQRKSKLTAKEITDADTKIIKTITDSYNSRFYKMTRTEETLVDILHTWNAKPFAAMLDGECVGWFAADKNFDYLHEFGYVKDEYIEDILLLILETSGKNSVHITVPPFDAPLCNYLGLNCEYYNIGHSEQFTILNYERVIKAFLELKASYTKLCDGEIVMFIEGAKLPEQIKITVKDDKVSVEETDEKPDIALGHLEAMRLIGSFYSEKRNELPANIQSWFPLPFFSYSLDNV